VAQIATKPPGDQRTTSIWVARRQERTIAYLKEENRVFREKLGRSVPLTDPERRHLATLGKELGL
jgi:hypothetical protein